MKKRLLSMVLCLVMVLSLFTGMVVVNAEGPFHITFNANGGTGTMTVQKLESGESQALTPNAFTRTGYDFVGWNTQADGKGTAYADKAEITLTADLTLYAQWKEAAATSTVVLMGDTNKLKLTQTSSSTSRWVGKISLTTSATSYETLPAYVTLTSDAAGSKAINGSAFTYNPTTGALTITDATALKGTIYVWAYCDEEDDIPVQFDLEYVSLVSGSGYANSGGKSRDTYKAEFEAWDDSTLPNAISVRWVKYKGNSAKVAYTLAEGTDYTYEIKSGLGVLAISASTLADLYDDYINSSGNNYERGYSYYLLVTVNGTENLVDLRYRIGNGSGMVEKCLLLDEALDLINDIADSTTEHVSATITLRGNVYTKNQILIPENVDLTITEPSGKDYVLTSTYAGTTRKPGAIVLNDNVSLGLEISTFIYEADTALVVPSGVTATLNSSTNLLDGVNDIDVSGTLSIASYTGSGSITLTAIDSSVTASKYLSRVYSGVSGYFIKTEQSGSNYIYTLTNEALSGTCGAEGDNLTWTLDTDGILTICGTGEMDAYSWGDPPWWFNRSEIQTIVLEKGISSIAPGAFLLCNNLKTIYYSGSEEDWTQIDIGADNNSLERTTKHYDCDFFFRTDSLAGHTLQVVYADDGLHVHGNVSSGSPVYIAVYDARGKMLSIRYLNNVKDHMLLPGFTAKLLWVTTEFVPKSEAISIPLKYSPYDPSSVLTFSDVSVNAKYHEQVEFVTGMGLMSGYGDGMFHPNDNMTIAEYLTILYKYMREQVPSVIPEKDTSGTEAAQWMNIYLLGGTYPDLSVNMTHYDMADITYVTLRVVAIYNGEYQTRTTHGFTDISSEHQYYSVLAYLESVYVLDRSIFDEVAYTFQGEQYLKRAEAAIILHNMYNM